MMSIGTVKSADKAADYYTRKDNYYVIESLDECWQGAGAAALGLEGKKVDKALFTALLHGRLPDGVDLSRFQGKANRHRPGYDLTFSAPKSVSVIAMLDGDRRLINAHNHAVEETIRLVEKMAATRVMVGGKSETVLTRNLIVATFNHDTNRNQEPLLHTHSVVINATRNGDRWQTLATDTVGKSGFIENVYANQIAIGKFYREILKQKVEILGYETEVVGKHGMWELKGVPVKCFSTRTQEVDATAGPDASPKSRDVAALETRKPKMSIDPAKKMTEWLSTLQKTGFSLQEYQGAASKRALESRQEISVITPSADTIRDAVSQAISGLSDRKIQFTYTELLARTVSQLEIWPGVIESARTGIDAAIEQEQLIPLDREKGIFTSGIHILDELSVKALVKEVKRQNHVVLNPKKVTEHQAPFSNAVSILAQDRPVIAIVSGQGGATGQRERVVELTRMAREQGRDRHIIAADSAALAFLLKEERLAGETITRKDALQDGTAFVPGGTLIADQAEKLSLKEMIALLDGALRNNVQVLMSDSGKWSGTGCALTVLKNSGVSSYNWLGGKQAEISIISEPDKRIRFEHLARDYVKSIREGIESIAQVRSPRDQSVLTGLIRINLRSAGILGPENETITGLIPVWLDCRNRCIRDNYREGMVMEHWVSGKRSHERFIIDRVTVSSNTLTLKNENGKGMNLRISAIDNSWTLFSPQQLQVAVGERLAILGKIPNSCMKGGETVYVKKMEKDALIVQYPGQKNTHTLVAGNTPFSGIKVNHGWVESPGRSVSETANVFASLSQRELDNASLNTLTQSGSELFLYSALSERKTTERLKRHTVFSVVSEQLRARAGVQNIDAAITHLKNQIHTPVEQAIHLAVPILETDGLAFSYPQLLVAAHEFLEEKLSFTDIEKGIQEQIKVGSLLHIPVSSGHGNDLLISRQTWDAEKSLLTMVLAGKESLSPLMDNVPATLLEGLTPGQCEATRMILETGDRFTLVQGYAGVGKTTQFRAVLKAINLLPEHTRPHVIGIGPTHRAVSEMHGTGVEAQTTASFLHDMQQLIRSGGKPDFTNTVFLVDESSMLGLSDIAKAMNLIVAGKGRAVFCGDSDQLQPISPGQPFRLMQQRSAADVAIMQDIVRQVPELRPAVYSLLNHNIHSALSTIEKVTPVQVPRRRGAWMPQHSVMEITPKQEKFMRAAAEKGECPRSGEPVTLYEAIVKDYVGRTEEAQAQTLVITHLNDDRRRLNRMIHDEKMLAGELGKESLTLPVLTPGNIRDGELRKLTTWRAHTQAIALVDNRYYQIEGVSKADRLITLRDEDGVARLISPREASAEGVTLYTQEQITVSPGDRVRFSKSDTERGYVANSVWQVKEISGESVILSDGNTTRTVTPSAEKSEAHIDLAYAITTHGAQGASEPFSIVLEGITGARARMVSFESAYVALTRMIHHTQIYTDDRKVWSAAVSRSQKKASLHDILESGDDFRTKTALDIFNRAESLQCHSDGRAFLKFSGLDKGDCFGRCHRQNKNDAHSYLIFKAFNSNGKPAGIWLSPLKRMHGQKKALADEGHVIGDRDARFIAFQKSRNNESLLCSGMQEGIALARALPDTGIVVRLSGNGRPWNPGALTGGRIWRDNLTPGATVQVSEVKQTMVFQSTADMIPGNTCNPGNTIRAINNKPGDYHDSPGHLTGYKTDAEGRKEKPLRRQDRDSGVDMLHLPQGIELNRVATSDSQGTQNSRWYDSNDLVIEKTHSDD